MVRSLPLLIALSLLSCRSPTEDDGFGVRLEGRVLTAAGAPAAGYLVQTHLFTQSDCTGSILVPSASDVTDAQGSFSFDVPVFAPELVCLWPLVRPDAQSGIVAVGDSLQVVARRRPYPVVTDTLRLP